MHAVVCRVVVYCVANQLVEHHTACGAVARGNKMATAVSDKPLLFHAVVVALAVVVVERLLAKVGLEGLTIGAGLNRACVDVLPAGCGLAVGCDVVAQARFRRAVQVDGHVFGGLAELRAGLPRLGDVDVNKLGVGVAALGNLSVVGRAGIQHRRIPLGIDALASRLVIAAAVARRRERNLEVERAVALVHDLDDRVVGGGVVGEFVAVVEAAIGARGDDLGAAVYKDVVLVACGHLGAIGVKDGVRGGLFR